MERALHSFLQSRSSRLVGAQAFGGEESTPCGAQAGRHEAWQAGPGTEPAPQTGVGARRVRIFISYKHDADPDETVALQVFHALHEHHDVFIDQTMLVGTRWAERIQAEIRQADFLIPFLSAQSVHSEMVQGEIETAHHLAKEQAGRPAILPVRLAYREPFQYPLSVYLNRINWASWKGPDDTPRLIEELMRAVSGAGLSIDTDRSKADLIRVSPSPPLPPPVPAAQPVALETPEGTHDVSSGLEAIKNGGCLPVPGDCFTMPDLPAGTVTFLFTDIEGSTQRWEQDRAQMQVDLARHDALLRGTIETNGGTVFKTVGDAFCATFASALNAVTAAVDAQRSLHAETWGEPGPLRVRIALHTGEAERRDDDYFGPALNRIARLLNIAHGGQTLLSQATYELVCDTLPAGVELKDLGSHHLKDLQRPEHVFQLRCPDLPSDFPPLRSLNVLPNNLPHQLTSFIGRERQMADAHRLLQTTRLLTLTGTGGCGKTRLALQVAANRVEDYPDGVWLVELAPLADPALVPQTVASVLGVREEPGRPLPSTLADYLKSRRLLLVLDNCEHLVAACATLAHALLVACPGLQILATSREALRVPGETIQRVPSLSLPDPECLPPAREDLVAAVTQSESVRLFVDRSVAIFPRFRLTGQTAPLVAQVCQRLDGIPLAIELAAARVQTLSVEEIAARLDDRFRLLTKGSRTALPRQQTLRALIDWSYDLLSGEERALFRRLSVFAGGFSLAAAEAVCAGEGVEEFEVLDLLDQLVDKSLVMVEEQREERQYRLLETIRQYGLEQLRGSGEGAVLRGRHRGWFLGLAEEAEPALEGPEQGVWLDRLEQEHDNLRAALSWAKETGDAEAALRLGGALWRFWSVRGYLAEGWEQLAQIRSLPGAEVRTAARARAVNGAGALAHDQGNLQVASSLFEESLTIARELDDQGTIASSLLNLGSVAQGQGDYEGARSLFEQSLVIDQKLGNQWGIARSLNSLGNVARDQGDYVAARSLYEECLAIQRELGDRWGIAASLNNLGNAAHNQGDIATAHSFYEQSLVIWRELGDRIRYAVSLLNLGLIIQGRGDGEQAAGIYAESLALFQELGDKSGIAACLMELGGVAGSRGQPERAARLYAAAQALREAIGTSLPPSDYTEYERQLATAQTQLGAEAFAAAWAEGQAMSLQQAMAYATETAVVGEG